LYWPHRIHLDGHRRHAVADAVFLECRILYCGVLTFGMHCVVHRHRMELDCLASCCIVLPPQYWYDVIKATLRTYDGSLASASVGPAKRLLPNAVDFGGKSEDEAEPKTRAGDDDPAVTEVCVAGSTLLSWLSWLWLPLCGLGLWVCLHSASTVGCCIIIRMTTNQMRLLKREGVPNVILLERWLVYEYEYGREYEYERGVEECRVFLQVKRNTNNGKVCGVCVCL